MSHPTIYPSPMKREHSAWQLSMKRRKGEITTECDGNDKNKYQILLFSFKKSIISKKEIKRYFR